MSPDEIAKRADKIRSACKAAGMANEILIAACIIADVIHEGVAGELESIRRELDFIGNQCERIGDRT